MVLIPSVMIDVCLHPSLCGRQLYCVKKAQMHTTMPNFYSQALFLILDFLTFSIHSNEFSNTIRKQRNQALKMGGVPTLSGNA